MSVCAVVAAPKTYIHLRTLPFTLRIPLGLCLLSSVNYSGSSQPSTITRVGLRGSVGLLCVTPTILIQSVRTLLSS